MVRLPAVHCWLHTKLSDSVGTEVSDAMRILIVEDERKTAAFLCRGLGEAGVDTDVEHDGEQGLRRAWPRELSALAAEFNHMLERLQEFLERLSRFSADLAHEVRTPLHNLMGETQQQRLARMLESMLFFARAERSEVRELQADSLLLRRALSNLVSNSSSINSRPCAALLALGIGVGVLGICSLLGDAWPAAAHLFTIHRPTGPLSGVTDAAIIAWLVSWAVLNWRWRTRALPLERIVWVTALLFVLGLVLTFPPFMDLLQGK